MNALEISRAALLERLVPGDSDPARQLRAELNAAMDAELLLARAAEAAASDAAVDAFFALEGIGVVRVAATSGRILRANRHFASLLGHTVEQVTDVSLPLQVFTPGGAARDSGLSATAPAEWVCAQLHHRDGHPIDVALVRAAEDGDSVAWVGLVQEIRSATAVPPPASVERSAREHAALIRLHALGAKLLADTPLTAVLHETLEGVLALEQADAGCIQIFHAGSRQLETVAQHGLPPEALANLNATRTDGGATAQAVDSLTRVLVAVDATSPNPPLPGFQTVQAIPLLDPGGKPLGVLTTLFRRMYRPGADDVRLTDLFARHAAVLIGYRRAKDGLRASEAQVRAVYERSTVGVLLLDPADGTIRHANAAITDLLGTPADALVGREAAGFVHPSDRTRLAATLQALRANETNNLEPELRLLRRNGTAAWVELALTVQCERDRPVQVIALVQDISRRKEAELALGASERRLSAIVAQAPVGLSELSPEGRFEQVNAALCRMVGRSESELLALGVADITHPDDIAPSFAAVGRLLATGKVQTVEKRYLHANGSAVWATSILTRLDDADRPARILAVTVDLTERRRQEVNVQVLSGLQSELSHESDAEAVIPRVAARTAAHLGLSRLRLCAVNLADDRMIKVHEWHRPDLRPFPEIRSLSRYLTLEDVRALERGEVRRFAPVPQDERTAETGTGQQENGASTQVIAPYVSGGSLRFILTAERVATYPWRQDEIALLRELTSHLYLRLERARAEHALRASEEKFRQVSESNMVSIVFFELGGRLTDANDAFLQMTGYTREEIRCGGVMWQHLTPPEWRPVVHQWEADIQRHGRVMPHEHEYLRKDGTRCWGMFGGARVQGAGNAVAFVIDVSERKDAEEQVRRYHEGLEERVLERTAELDHVNGALRDEIVERQRAERARQNLLRQLVSAQEEERRRISRELHDEVGQHLTALMLGLKSLETQVSTQSKLETVKSLQDLTQTVGREIHQLAVELRPTALDDLGLVRMLSNHVEDWSTRTSIPVDFHASGWSDQRLPSPIESTVYRVVQEALTNIVKHARAHRVSVILERRADHLITIVEDDGVGFSETPPAVRPGRIPLGILGMKERAALADGDLQIESAAGEGTTVILRIPLPVEP